MLVEQGYILICPHGAFINTQVLEEKKLVMTKLNHFYNALYVVVVMVENSRKRPEKHIAQTMSVFKWT